MGGGGEVPGTRVQLQVRPRAQVASPPAPRASEPPGTPPGRRGAARGDKDDRPPRDPAGQHGGRRPRGTGPRARAGPRSGGPEGGRAGGGGAAAGPRCALPPSASPACARPLPPLAPAAAAAAAAALTSVGWLISNRSSRLAFQW